MAAPDFDIDFLCSEIDRLQAENKRLQAELAAAKADAKRYRFLKSVSNIETDYGRNNRTTQEPRYWIDWGIKNLGRHRLTIDAAIDAAREGK